MYLFKGTRDLFRVILILILSCSLLASCAQTPDSEDNGTPQNGAEDTASPEGETPNDSTTSPEGETPNDNTTSPEEDNQHEEETSWKDKLFEASNVTGGMMPNILIRLFAETSEINVGDDLPVAFLYRFIDERSEIPKTPFTVNTKVTMESYKYELDGPVHTVGQLINEQLVNEYDDYFIASLEEYTFHGRTFEGRVEQTVVPAEWFSCNRGSIELIVWFDYDIPDNPESEMHFDFGAGVSIYYIRTGDTIKLFHSNYEFNNYGKE